MNLLKMFFALMLFVSVSSASLRFEIIFKTDELHFENNTIVNIVNNALDLGNSKITYSDAYVFVYSKQDGLENYLVVMLQQPDSYSGKSYRLDLLNTEVVKVTEDYIEEDPIEPGICATCPDTQVEVLVCYITQFSPAKPAAENVISELKRAGIKYAVLVDNQENKTSLLNYLSCPKLKVFGRIGHGYAPGSIGLGKASSGVTLTTKDITTSPFKEVIKNKYYPFNCCEVGGDRNTFGKGLISSGAKWMYAGDDVSISAGSSEPAWAKFMIDACVKKLEVIATFDKYLTNLPDKYRYQKSGSGPFYIFPTTGITNLIAETQSKSLFITARDQSVTFNSNPGQLFIHTVSGKLIYQNEMASPSFIWNMRTLNNETAGFGYYVATVKNDVNTSVSKKFLIANY